MVIRYTKIIAIIICLFSISSQSLAYTDIEEKQINVTMRMIGHELLLCVNDHTSRILAIEKDEDRYKIEFSSEFEFNPDDLIPIVKENLKKTGINENYIVEVEECSSKQVIYSYQIGGTNYSNLTPCGGRSQPKACYKLFITLLKDVPHNLDQSGFEISLLNGEKENLNYIEPTTNYTKLSMFGLPALLLAGLLFLFIKRKEKPTPNSNLIPVGNSLFDENNMQLTLGKEVTELTSKEADLLSLLVSHSNNTIEREEILKTVWGDEGDYVGRTLDVFISKLRKKLEADASVKIINIRGVGYKLILN